MILNEGLTLNRASIDSKKPSRMRRGLSHDRGALRPEFEELVDLLELIELLELNVEANPQGPSIAAKKKRAA